MKKQIKDQSKEIEELKNLTSDIPPLRPKLEVEAPRVDLTIDSTEDENETLKSKIAEVEGRDPRSLKNIRQNFMNDCPRIPE